MEMEMTTRLRLPTCIDAVLEDRDSAWARTLKRTRHVTDTSGRKDHDACQAAFQRLLLDLELGR